MQIQGLDKRAKNFVALGNLLLIPFVLLFLNSLPVAQVTCMPFSNAIDPSDDGIRSCVFVSSTCRSPPYPSSRPVPCGNPVAVLRGCTILPVQQLQRQWRWCLNVCGGLSGCRGQGRVTLVEVAGIKCNGQGAQGQRGPNIIKALTPPANGVI